MIGSVLDVGLVILHFTFAFAQLDLDWVGYIWLLHLDLVVIWLVTFVVVTFGLFTHVGLLLRLFTLVTWLRWVDSLLGRISGFYGCYIYTFVTLFTPPPTVGFTFTPFTFCCVCCYRICCLVGCLLRLVGWLFWLGSWLVELVPTLRCGCTLHLVGLHTFTFTLRWLVVVVTTPLFVCCCSLLGPFPPHVAVVYLLVTCAARYDCWLAGSACLRSRLQLRCTVWIICWLDVTHLLPLLCPGALHWTVPCLIGCLLQRVAPFTTLYVGIPI